MKLTKLTIIFIFLFGVVGCAKNHPCSKADVIYNVIVYDQDELTANNMAMAKVTGICNRYDLQAKLLNYDSRYMGYDDKQKKLIEVARQNIGSKAKATSHYDYQIMVKFKCVVPPISQAKAVQEAKRRADEAKQ